MSLDAKISDYEPLKRSKGEASKDSDEEWRPKKKPPVDTFGDGPTEIPSRRAIHASSEKPIALKSSDVRIVPLKQGHAITYASLFLFTAVLYFRPYEYIPALSHLSIALWLGVFTLIVFIVNQLALSGSLTIRTHEVHMVFLLILLALLSIPLAISPGEAWATFNDTFVRAVLIFIVIVNSVRTEKRLYGLLFLSLAVAAFLSIGAIRDYASGNLSLLGYRIQGSIGGMFGNPNDLAIHLGLSFPIALALLLRSRSLLIKFSLGLCALLIVAGTVSTFSRGGFLGLMVGAFVLAWKLGKKKRVLSIAALLVGGVGFLLLAPGDYRNRILSIFGLAPDSLGSAAARKNLLTHSIYTSLRHPLGIGMGNYHIVGAQEAVSHNAYTQIAAELGIAALIVYVLFMVFPIRKLWEVERSSFGHDDQKGFYYLAIGLQGSLAAYMTSSFFASVGYQWYVYYLVGYAVCFYNIYAAKVGLRVERGKTSTSSRSIETKPLAAHEMM
jgi:putative inorganic carbon (HCO3(-)) transporter